MKPQRVCLRALMSGFALTNLTKQLRFNRPQPATSPSLGDQTAERKARLPCGGRGSPQEARSSGFRRDLAAALDAVAAAAAAEAAQRLGVAVDSEAAQGQRIGFLTAVGRAALDRFWGWRAFRAVCTKSRQFAQIRPEHAGSSARNRKSPCIYQRPDCDGFSFGNEGAARGAGPSFPPARFAAIGTRAPPPLLKRPPQKTNRFGRDSSAALCFR